MVTNIIKEEEDREENISKQKYKNWEWKKPSDRKEKRWERSKKHGDCLQNKIKNEATKGCFWYI